MVGAIDCVALPALLSFGSLYGFRETVATAIPFASYERKW
jgi:hypothetical protein